MLPLTTTSSAAWSGTAYGAEAASEKFVVPLEAAIIDTTVTEVSKLTWLQGLEPVTETEQSPIFGPFRI